MVFIAMKFLLTLILTFIVKLSVIFAADALQSFWPHLLYSDNTFRRGGSFKKDLTFDKCAETALNDGKQNIRRVFNTFLLPLSKSVNHSRSYFEDDDNVLRLPEIKKTYDYKSKKKTFKKSPKRTIQKIIKKNKSKTKKLYLNQMTTEPAKPSVNIDPYDVIQEDLPQNNDVQTTQATQRKKVRKWNAKHTRYPMPFQKLQPRKDIFRRTKRDTDRGLFILEDLDEMEFLSNEDENGDIVRAHVKNYW